MSNLIAIIVALGPLINKWWPAIQSVIKAAEAIMGALGIKPSDALKAAAEIQFRLRPPTKEEEEAMFLRGMEKADSNHDFPYKGGD